MKYLTIFLLLVSCTLGYQLHKIKRDYDAKSFVLAQNSAETGCYYESKVVCGKVSDDFQRNDCYTAALSDCPDMAIRFKQWLENGAP